jgi:hypothetical protein
MLEEAIRSKIRNYCNNNNFNYYEIVIFVENHIKETQYILRRKLNRDEIIKLTLNALYFLNSEKEPAIHSIKEVEYIGKR